MEIAVVGIYRSRGRYRDRILFPYIDSDLSLRSFRAKGDSDSPPRRNPEWSKSDICIFHIKIYPYGSGIMWSWTLCWVNSLLCLELFSFLPLLLNITAFAFHFFCFCFYCVRRFGQTQERVTKSSLKHSVDLIVCALLGWARYSGLIVITLNNLFPLMALCWAQHNRKSEFKAQIRKKAHA